MIIPCVVQPVRIAFSHRLPQSFAAIGGGLLVLRYPFQERLIYGVYIRYTSGIHQTTVGRIHHRPSQSRGKFLRNLDQIHRPTVTSSDWVPIIRIPHHATCSTATIGVLKPIQPVQTRLIPIVPSPIYTHPVNQVDESIWLLSSESAL